MTCGHDESYQLSGTKLYLEPLSGSGARAGIAAGMDYGEVED